MGGISQKARCPFIARGCSRGKKKSRASTERHNQNRTLAGSEEVTRQVSGCQADLKCVYLGHEIAFSEVGLFDEGENGTKETVREGGFKSTQNA